MSIFGLNMVLKRSILSNASIKVKQCGVVKVLIYIPKQYFTDIHIHILPGIDDGARNMEQTAKMLYMAAARGTGKIIATPHYSSGRFMAAPEKIKELTAIVKEMGKTFNAAVDVYSGNEIFYSEETERLLNENKILTMANSDCVLVEFAPAADYSYIRNAVDSLIGGGYHPIIAHIERYEVFVTNPERVEDVHSMGAYIQMNANSVIGQTGTKIKRFCRKMLDDEMVDFIGSDAHHDTGHRTPDLKKCAAYISRRYGKSYADRVFRENAERLIFNAYERIMN